MAVLLRETIFCNSKSADTCKREDKSNVLSKQLAELDEIYHAYISTWSCDHQGFGAAYVMADEILTIE